MAKFWPTGKYGDYFEYQSRIALGELPGVEVDFRLDGAQVHLAFTRAINAHMRESPYAPSAIEMLRILLEIAETEIPAA